MAIRHMECCVCGDDAGRFEQHWNRDTGYGICRRCVDWVRSRGETDAEILDLYGVEGVNYAAPAVAPSPPRNPPRQPAAPARGTHRGRDYSHDR